MFLFTIFLMDGPKPVAEATNMSPSAPKVTGHDNSTFTDETGLPTITSLVENTKDSLHETSRL